MTPSSVEYLCFDRVADIYDATRFIPAESLQDTARLIMENGGLLPGDRFLDAGVGTGRFARHLAGAGLTVVGADISTGMLSRARSAAANLRLVQADLRRLPLRSHSVPGALIVHILHLITDWKRVVHEIRRVLHPGAPLYVGSEAGKHFLSRGTYFQIATERGLLRPHLGAASFDAVLEYLTETGAEVKRIDDGRVEWTATVRVSDMLNTLRSNPFSSCWSIPAEENASLVREAERRLQEAFPSLDTVEESPAHFVLWSARWPD